MFPALDLATTSLMGRKFSVLFRGGTLMDPLNTIIDAHEGAMWDVAEEAGRNRSLSITIRTFDLSGVSSTTLTTR